MKNFDDRKDHQWCKFAALHKFVVFSTTTATACRSCMDNDSTAHTRTYIHAARYVVKIDRKRGAIEIVDFRNPISRGISRFPK